MDKRLYDYIEYAVNQARNALERPTIEISPDELESALTALKTRAYDFEPVWGTHWVVVVNVTK